MNVVPEKKVNLVILKDSNAALIFNFLGVLVAFVALLIGTGIFKTSDINVEFSQGLVINESWGTIYITHSMTLINNGNHVGLIKKITGNLKFQDSTICNMSFSGNGYYDNDGNLQNFNDLVLNSDQVSDINLSFQENTATAFNDTLHLLRKLYEVDAAQVKGVQKGQFIFKSLNDVNPTIRENLRVFMTKKFSIFREGFYYFTINITTDKKTIAKGYKFYLRPTDINLLMDQLINQERYILSPNSQIGVPNILVKVDD